MTAIKVKTADLALAVAGAALAGIAGWRPGVLPAWFCLVPIGLLVLQNLALVPHQVLVAHVGLRAARRSHNFQVLVKEVLSKGAEPAGQAAIVRRGWTAEARMRRQMDDWCRAHRNLPTIGVIRCGDCGAGMAARWRSAGDSIKLGCMECGLETDIPRGRDWKVRGA